MRIASGIRGVADLAEEEATENLNPLKVNIRFAGWFAGLIKISTKLLRSSGALSYAQYTSLPEFL